MENLVGAPPRRSFLGLVGDIGGIVSLFIAVIQQNQATLTAVQRWGLALAGAVAIWVFFFSAHIRIVNESAPESSGTRLGFVFFGGLIISGLLMAMLPYFAFGLPASEHVMLVGGAAGAYLVVSVLWAFGSIFN